MCVTGVGLRREGKGVGVRSRKEGMGLLLSSKGEVFTTYALINYVGLSHRC